MDDSIFSSHPDLMLCPSFFMVASMSPTFMRSSLFLSKALNALRAAEDQATSHDIRIQGPYTPAIFRKQQIDARDRSWRQLVGDMSP